MVEEAVKEVESISAAANVSNFYIRVPLFLFTWVFLACVVVRIFYMATYPLFFVLFHLRIVVDSLPMNMGW